MTVERGALPRTHVAEEGVDFQALLDGDKGFVVLPFDHDVDSGDRVYVVEIDPGVGRATGRFALGEVTYVTSSDNHCALSPEALNSDMCVASLNFDNFGSGILASFKRAVAGRLRAPRIDTLSPGELSKLK